MENEEDAFMLCWKPSVCPTSCDTMYCRSSPRFRVALRWVLEEAGYTTIVQQWDFRPGHNFAELMDTTIQTSERTIAVLSSEYLKSDFAKSEWLAAFAADQFVQIRDRPNPALVHQSVNPDHPPQYFERYVVPLVGEMRGVVVPRPENFPRRRRRDGRRCGHGRTSFVAPGAGQPGGSKRRVEGWPENHRTRCVERCQR